MAAVVCLVLTRVTATTAAPRPAAPEPAAASHWSLRPLTKPAVPAVARAGWVRNPVDAFVLARLEAAGMAPAAEADRRTLLRRVYFNLTGLPPTPDEVDAFVADPSPDAYERRVDALLASARYGERWARHWIDAVHFAETHGNDQDRERPNAWPYRDYLVRSFNADKPYARFVEEQLAGDVLYPDDPAATVATGFIAAGPWDESSQLNIVDATLDKSVARNLDRDDMLTTAMSTFVSTTVHCARCHDHKFDPVTQDEYYNLQSVFAGVDRANRPYDVDAATARERRRLAARLAELPHAPDSLLLAPAAQQEAAAWELALGQRANPWTVLQPASLTSAAGAAAARQPDGSYLFSGGAADVDTYTFVAPTHLTSITALRVEVLADDSLPHRGPGRQDNGNLHLSEVDLQVAPRVAYEAQPHAAPWQSVRLKNAAADFEQDGWTSAMAIDGNPKTAWGIYPQVGRSHAAVFETGAAIGDGATMLRIVLRQEHGGRHLIGRARLSVTSAAPPVKPFDLPDDVGRILATAAVERSDAQRATLARYALLTNVEARLAALPPQRMVYAATTSFKAEQNFRPANGCRPIFVLRRGDVAQPGEAARPGALSCVPGLESTFTLADPADEGARRAALAKWVTDPKNVLTWRSVVNRAWHHAFGRGIVDTPNDFGRMGGAPSHPELLDWLAVTFRDDYAGSLKALHRLVVTSSTYRQSCAHHAEYAARDGGNRLLWRMNRARLDAESIRDAVLQMSGKLDLTMGGPSVKQFVERKGVHEAPVLDYAGFDPDTPGASRRSIYSFLFRTMPDPLMESLDCPDASQLTPARAESTTALQALSMMNNALVVRQSEHLAARLAAAHPGDPAGQVDALYRLAVGRPATPVERELFVRHAGKHGLANVCRLVLNSNEFVFVD